MNRYTIPCIIAALLATAFIGSWWMVATADAAPPSSRKCGWQPLLVHDCETGELIKVVNMKAVSNDGGDTDDWIFMAACIGLKCDMAYDSWEVQRPIPCSNVIVTINNDTHPPFLAPCDAFGDCDRAFFPNGWCPQHACLNCLGESVDDDE